MDLIAQVIGGILAFFASVIWNIFAHDICASADAVCAKIIKAAAARLAPIDPPTTEQEWLADLWERQTVSDKYRHAIGCYLVAPSMRRYYFKVPPPLIDAAPGFYWASRKNGVWEGRWRSSVEALEKGWKIKSVKLYAMRGHHVDAEDEEFIADTARSLQDEHNQWLKDYDSSAKSKPEE